jgi:phosphoglycerol transferase MdoB-like AlkP superfamily enzyme
MVIGIWLDAIIAGGVALTVALAALLLPSSRWAEKILIWLGTLELTFLALAELAGWFFFSYFDFRPNYLVLEHVSDPEVFKTLSAGYPWVRIVLALLTVAAISHYLLTRMLRGSLSGRKRDRLATAGVAILMSLCIRGTFDHRPLNPSFASFSSNRLANELAGNGVLNVLNELAMGYNEQYAWVRDVAGRMSVPDAFSFARARLASSGAFIEHADNPLQRHVAAGARHDFNVVVVVMEGFAARLAGAWEGDLPLSPSCDRWAAQGLLFENCFATGERTVQGLEAVLSSYPPLPGVSVVRRPQARAGGFATLASTLKPRGYETAFYYGGQGIFDYMKGFFLANGYDYFIEEGDFEDVSFRGSWGVCDEDVFRQIDRDLMEHHHRGQPFFATFLTVSFHSPYEYPPGKSPEISVGTRIPSGFKKTELNNYLYADWAVGDFLQTASTRDYFSNTVFLFVGDHGIHLRGNNLVPLNDYRVVAFMLVPGLQPRRISIPVSQMDCAPTLLGILGGEWNTPFFGRDILAPAEQPPRALMVYNKRNYGILEGSDFLMLAEAKPAAFRVMNKFRLDPTEMTPHHVRIVNEGLGTLHAAEQLLHAGNYRDSGSNIASAKLSFVLSEESGNKEASGM